MSSEVITSTEIMRKNIAAVIEMQRNQTQAHTLPDRMADFINHFAGSMTFVYIHALWFGSWIPLNTGVLKLRHISGFYPYPFSLLTMIVSLEAIFLSTFVLIAQNRLSIQSEQRAEFDLQVNLLAEQKAAKTIEMLDEITKQLNGMSRRFNLPPDPEVEALKRSPAPQEMLQVMEETVKGEAAAVSEKVSKVAKEVTGELDEVRTDVERIGEQVEEVTTDVDEIKDELKERTGEHQRATDWRP